MNKTASGPLNFPALLLVFLFMAFVAADLPAQEVKVAALKEKKLRVQVISPVSSLSAGLEHRRPLEQNVHWNGAFISAKKSVFRSFIISGQWRFLTETIAKNDFEHQQQVLHLGYRFRQGMRVEWQLTAGIIRERLKHQAPGFTSKTDEYGYLAIIKGHYQVDDNQRVGLALENQKIQDHNRYYLRPHYQYRLQQHWFITLEVSLGYNETFNHDINEYALGFRYAF